MREWANVKVFCFVKQTQGSTTFGGSSFHRTGVGAVKCNKVVVLSKRLLVWVFACFVVCAKPEAGAMARDSSSFRGASLHLTSSSQWGCVIHISFKAVRWMWMCYVAHWRDARLALVPRSCCRHSVSEYPFVILLKSPRRVVLDEQAKRLLFCWEFFPSPCNKKFYMQIVSGFPNPIHPTQPLSVLWKLFIPLLSSDISQKRCEQYFLTQQHFLVVWAQMHILLVQKNHRAQCNPEIRVFCLCKRDMRI